MITNKPGKQNIRKINTGQPMYKPYGNGQAGGALVTAQVDTDQGGGLLYCLVDTSLADPPDQTVKDTAQHAQGVSSAGTQDVKIKITLAPGTYYIHYVQETSFFSNVFTSPSFVVA